MTIAVVTYSIIYLVLFLAGRTGIFRHARKEQAAFNSTGSIALREITLIVPFRNEEHRILPLLHALLRSGELPRHIIFVDDHSTDKTVAIISSTLQPIRFQILHAEQEGKKSAILTGVKHSATKYILTMDADVSFPENYFSALEYLKTADMHVLPVRMTARGWKKIFEMDVYMVNSLNLIANGFSRTITASGANLLFNTASFREVSSYPSHAHLLSGDDQFLLADFNRAKKEVFLHSTAQLAVSTPAPASLKEFFSQRLRWIQKTPSVPDRLALKFGAIQLIATVFFLFLLAATAIQANSLLFVFLLGIKCLLDALLVSPYFLRLEKQNLLSLLPVYELILPVYTMVLGFASLFVKPTWKGRKTI